MMNKPAKPTPQKLRRILLPVLAVFLVAAALAVHFFGGQGVVPGWQQLRSALGVPLQTEESAPQTAPGSTVVYVFDVGQGDAVLLAQDGSYCLIDTGPKESEDLLLYDLESVGVEQLDYLVLTHPHADHTGNAAAVLRALPVQTLLLPAWVPTADTTADFPKSLYTAAADTGTTVTTAAAGQQYALGSGTLQILQGGDLAADGEADTASDIVNNASLCTLFTAGEFRFLSTGDAEQAAEQTLVDTYGTALHATLFKAGHHGSYTSNSDTLLQVVRPQAVAVSCGLNNDYGHPHKAALQHFADVNAAVYRTDLQGSLTFTWQQDTLTVTTTADTADQAA